LGFTLNLGKGEITDNIGAVELNKKATFALSVLLSHYACSSPSPLTGKLVKFSEIPGGRAYEGAFIARAVAPIAGFFGNRPQELLKATAKLNGKPARFGDVSAHFEALKGIPLTYILWKADEFPATAHILYDASASSYLPTEDLAVLGELATSRLIQVASRTFTA